MKRKVLLGLVGSSLLMSVVAVGAGPEAPEPVSPGSWHEVEAVAQECPTFSWSASNGAEAYELVVYRVGEGGDENQPFLKRRFRGTVASWTPSLDWCLERGGRYAWSVRAVGRKEASDWSPPSLFEVAAGPSREEFEEMVSLVRQYLTSNAPADAPVEAERMPIPQLEELRGASSEPLTVSSEPLAPATTQLSVDGNIDAISFTGDGSNLLGIGNPDPPCFDTTNRFVDCANGTVTDTVTGLIYLKNANCFGPQNWPAANESAAALADGVCDLMDGSRAGDWRLQTKEEWERILDSACDNDPEIVGNNGCYSEPGSAWASDVQFSFYWSSSTELGASSSAWIASMTDGTVSTPSKSNTSHVWPVRGGQ